MPTSLVVVVVVAVLGWVILYGAVRRQVMRRFPRNVVHRLRAGHATVCVRVGGPFLGGAGQWNPSRPFRYSTLLRGLGLATYSLRVDQVHLVWEPHTGAREEFTGPIPPYLTDASTEDSRQRLRSRRTLLLAALVSLATIAVPGILVGLATNRVTYGALATATTFGVLPFLSTGQRIWNHRQRRQR